MEIIEKEGTTGVDMAQSTMGGVNLNLREQGNQGDEGNTEEIVHIANKERLQGRFGQHHAILDTECNRSAAGI